VKIFAATVPSRFNWQDTATTTDEKIELNRQANEAAVRSWGYTGARTGKIVRDQVADGYASYMVMEKGKAISLMCMDWIDGYQSPWAHRWTRGDVVKLIERQEAFEAFFARKTDILPR
jgi:hypothetical protein